MSTIAVTTAATPNMSYKFARRTNNLPDGIDRAKTFESDQIIDALQQASDYWFNGRKVDTWLKDKNDVTTLLCGWGQGNVIGTLMDNTEYSHKDKES